MPESIKVQGWPTLEDVRGTVMFALDNEGCGAGSVSRQGIGALKDRVMFATVAREDPAAAWFKINDPIKSFDRIKSLSERASWSERRADADTVQSRKNDRPSAKGPRQRCPIRQHRLCRSPIGVFLTTPFVFLPARSPAPTRSAATPHGPISTSRPANPRRLRERIELFLGACLISRPVIWIFLRDRLDFQDPRWFCKVAIMLSKLSLLIVFSTGRRMGILSMP